MAKYKKNVVRDANVQWMCGGEQAGTLRMECPKCRYQFNVGYCYTKSSSIEPKYCPYCGECLVEKSDDE